MVSWIFFHELGTFVLIILEARHCRIVHAAAYNIVEITTHLLTFVHVFSILCFFFFEAEIDAVSCHIKRFWTFMLK